MEFSFRYKLTKEILEKKKPRIDMLNLPKELVTDRILCFS